jgi:hypothetical protein
MIYRKEEYVEHAEGDEQFPIKEVDRLIEVDGDGQRFIGRAVLNMQTNMGVQQMPISIEIDAESIQDAFKKYTETAEPKIEEVRERIENRIAEMRRQAQNRIVTPTGEAAQGQGEGGGIINLEDLQT